LSLRDLYMDPGGRHIDPDVKQSKLQFLKRKQVPLLVGRFFMVYRYVFKTKFNSKIFRIYDLDTKIHLNIGLWFGSKNVKIFNYIFVNFSQIYQYQSPSKLNQLLLTSVKDKKKLLSVWIHINMTKFQNKFILVDFVYTGTEETTKKVSKIFYCNEKEA